MSVNRVTLVEVDQVCDDYQKHPRHFGVHDGPCGEGTVSRDERRWVGDLRRVLQLDVLGDRKAHDAGGFHQMGLRDLEFQEVETTNCVGGSLHDATIIQSKELWYR